MDPLSEDDVAIFKSTSIDTFEHWKNELKWLNDNGYEWPTKTKWGEVITRKSMLEDLIEGYLQYHQSLS